MKISIITINYNDAKGLQRTLESVWRQTYRYYEQIVVDGGSMDSSVAVIRSFEEQYQHAETRDDKPTISWVSEKDKGVYDAQNKGIRMATGDYCFFLNAGDVFCADDVLERMFADVEDTKQTLRYGNLCVVEDGKQVAYCKGMKTPTFLDLYNSCLKHQSTFISRDLFTKYGDYDSTLRIVADWEWFFRVAAFHDEVRLQYADVDVADFDNAGVSNRSPQVCKTERQAVLDSYLSQRMQADYRLLSQFYNLRYIARSKTLTFVQRVVGKIGKIRYGKRF